MTPSRRGAVAGLVAGAMLAATAGMALYRGAGKPATATPALPSKPPVASNLSRCRTLTMPDAGCDAAWEAERRRFFRDDRR
ncbi:putative entry exclusion protein TrbK-alt [Sphingomonas sp. OTU376]|uniref:putative entry exclusion protein TrbK-alt n=1 Tax=Sphingomonas sp. OTU376 TaxID=3043863 RepID=UPI00313EA8D1